MSSRTRILHLAVGIAVLTFPLFTFAQTDQTANDPEAGSSGHVLDQAAKLEGERYLKDLRERLTDAKAKGDAGASSRAITSLSRGQSDFAVREIFGVDNNLVAKIDDNGVPVRAVVGTKLSGGWTVVSIVPRTVTIEKGHVTRRGKRVIGKKTDRTLNLVFQDVDPPTIAAIQSPYPVPPLPAPPAAR